MGSKISSKGQVTVPKEVRDAMGLKAGDSVSFVVTDGGNAVLKAATKWTVDDMAGFLKGYAKKGPDISKEHREHLSKALAERDKRKRAR